MDQLAILHAIQTRSFPWLDTLMEAVTSIGNPDFYFTFVPVIMWTVNKRIGVRLAVYVMAALCLCELIKIVAVVPRPIGVPGIRSLYTSSAPGYSFPSGHTQGSAAFWGYLAYRAKNRVFSGFAAMLVVTIALSRLYLGVHWPLDVAFGLLLGVLSIGAGILVDRYLQGDYRVFALEWVAGMFVPAGCMLFYQHSGGDTAGFLLGVSTGYLLQARFLDYRIPHRLLLKIAVALTGSIGVLVLRESVSIVPGIYGAAIGYAVIGWWVTVIAPWLFVRVGWYRAAAKRM